MILKRLTVGPYMANCYIVGSEATKQGIIIDPGAEAENVLKSVKEAGLQIKTIVLTHGHPDHIGGALKVRQALNARIAIHADDAHLLRQVFYPKSDSPDQASLVLFKDGENIEFGDMRFLVLHTPGHSPGSICLLGHGILFSGDTLFNFGIGRYDIPGGDYYQEMTSIHTKLMVLPDQTIVYPGHGPETTIGTERRGNAFLRN